MWASRKRPMHLVLIVQILVLLTVANGTPVIARKLLGSALSYPLDGGIAFLDGRPLFGPTKTVRGFLLAVTATIACTALIGLGWNVGAVVGGVAMASDLLSSFIKRRMGLPPSSMALGLDQIPNPSFHSSLYRRYCLSRSPTSGLLSCCSSPAASSSHASCSSSMSESAPY